MNDQTVKYLSLQQLLVNRTFRIPDYQRGYAWGKKQLEDLWSDLINLHKGKLSYHYTGMITVEEIQQSEWIKWEDAHYFTETIVPFSVVDGQQRLTSVIVLMNEIINIIPDDIKINNRNKNFYIKKYILRDETEDAGINIKSFVFGYDTDNPSDVHFKAEILGYKEYAKGEQKKTAYTNNLSEAKQFFKERVKGYLEECNQNYVELANLLLSLLEKFKFDFKILEEDLDIFMVFETMNTRGKTLSNLESLKNRLIYLATLIYHIEQKGKITHSKQENELRSTIVDKWKDIYGYLGKSKRLMDSDNTLLKLHWIVYGGYDRKRANFHIEDIFDETFTVSKVINNQTGKDKISDYVASLETTAEWWFVINNPKHSDAIKKISDKKITETLVRITQLKFRFFAPLLFAGLQYDTSNKEKLQFLEAIESYIFLIFLVSYRRSNTGSYHFQALAHKLYQNEVSLKDVINSLEAWVYGGTDYYGYFDFKNFRQSLEPSFEQEEKNGYKDWAAIRYFLIEYYLREEKVDIDDKCQIISLYDGKILNREGFSSFKKYNNKKHKQYLRGSLGNLFFLKDIPVDFEKKSFSEIKSLLREIQPNSDILNYVEWTPQAIQDRGRKMLTFLENRWHIREASQNSVEKEKLLYLDFLPAS